MVQWLLYHWVPKGIDSFSERSRVRILPCTNSLASEADLIPRAKINFTSNMIWRHLAYNQKKNKVTFNRKWHHLFSFSQANLMPWPNAAGYNWISLIKSYFNIIKKKIKKIYFNKNEKHFHSIGKLAPKSHNLAICYRVSLDQKLL